MTRAGHTTPLQFRDIDEVADALRDGGGRFSASRRIVLEALFAADEPLSAEEVAGRPGASGHGTKLDATTVYRILERLEELGVVRHVHLGHGPGLYALTRDGGREYLVCDGCDRVTAVNPSQLDHIRSLVRETFGFEASFTHFPMVGLCARCATASPPPGPTGAAMSQHPEHSHDDAHSHEHSHGDETHSHPHTDHDHEHVEHEHEHEHGDETHAHPHVHESGLEEDHSHEH